MMLNHWVLFYYFAAFVVGVFSVGLSAVLLIKTPSPLLWSYLGLYLSFSFVTVTDIFLSYAEMNMPVHDQAGSILLFFVNLVMTYLFMFTLPMFSHVLFEVAAQKRRNLVIGVIALSGYIGLHGLIWYNGQAIPPDSLSFFFLDLPLAGMTVYCWLLSAQHYRRAEDPNQKRIAGKILAVFSGLTIIVLEDSIIGWFPGLLIYPVAYAGVGLFCGWYFIKCSWIYPVMPLSTAKNAMLSASESTLLSSAASAESDRPSPTDIGTDRAIDNLCERYQLSPREKDVLELLLQGHTNVQIAEHLFISVNTAKTHISNIYEKVGVKRRYELLARFQHTPPTNRPPNACGGGEPPSKPSTHPNG